MTEYKLQQLFEAATAMNKAWSMEVPSEEEDIVPCGDHRASAIEHVCHELSHAILLNVALGPKLSDRIAKRLKERVERKPRHYRGWSANDENEIQCFGATIVAMTNMGFECDIEVFVDACLVQTGGPKYEVTEAVSSFMDTERCTKVAERILRTISMWEGR